MYVPHNTKTCTTHTDTEKQCSTQKSKPSQAALATPHSGFQSMDYLCICTLYIIYLACIFSLNSNSLHTLVCLLNLRNLLTLNFQIIYWTFRCRAWTSCEANATNVLQLQRTLAKGQLVLYHTLSIADVSNLSAESVLDNTQRASQQDSKPGVPSQFIRISWESLAWVLYKRLQASVCVRVC